MRRWQNIGNCIFMLNCRWETLSVFVNISQSSCFKGMGIFAITMSIMNTVHLYFHDICTLSHMLASGIIYCRFFVTAHFVGKNTTFKKVYIFVLACHHFTDIIEMQMLVSFLLSENSHSLNSRD